MRFNTGNPVEPNGSSDPRDLLDTAAIADLLVNGPLAQYLSRLGVPLKSWRGMMQQVTDYLIAQGYESVFLAYGSGVVVQRQTQLVQREGELYRVKNGADIPLTLSGVWATDAPKLQSVGDAALRQALSGANGTTLIGDGTGTARDTLNALKAKDVELGIQVDTGNFNKNSLLSRIRSKISGGPLCYVLGDSISAGAFAGDLYRNSWVNIFKRMFNAEFNANSYGFSPPAGLINPVDGTLSFEVDDVLLTKAGGGTHSWVAVNSTTAEYLAQGLSFVSNAAGNIFRVTVASFQDTCVIYYVAQPGGGTFTVRRNGVVVGNVDTNAATIDPMARYGFAMNDNGYGQCVLEIETTSAGKVEACGWGYFDSTAQTVLQNFSTSGRKLRYLAEGTIASMMNGTSLFISALGINDADQNESDAAYYSEFVKRIDWLIQYSKLYEVPVLVLDFVWNFSSTNKTRTQLKRLATETNGSYIPFPDSFNKAGTQPGGPYLTNVLKLFTDGVHPTVDGHKLIAETAAKKIQFGITSKKSALDYCDWWYPLLLNSAAGVQNAGGSMRLVSATRNQGGQILVRLNVTGLAASQTKGIALNYPGRAGIKFDIPVRTQLSPTIAGVSQGILIFNAAGVSVITNAGSTDTAQQLFFSVARSPSHEVW